MGMQGMAQSVAVLAPFHLELLCLDDPFVGVDPWSSARIPELFKGGDRVLVVAPRTPIEGLRNVDFRGLRREGVE